MKKAYQYKDKKNSKFWWIDYSDTDFVVNFGKTGTIGRFQVEGFATPEKCEKQAQKLIAQKIKKGYQEDLNFDFQNRLYFDDKEMGTHQKTSHPNFTQHFTDEIYYNYWDEETPFGSDTGSDTLFLLEETLREKKDINLIEFIQNLIKKTYILPIANPTKEDLESQLEKGEDMEMYIYNTEQTIVATAFGSIKITGKIGLELKELALKSLKRIQLLAEVKDWGYSEIIQQLISDLENFK